MVVESVLLRRMPGVGGGIKPDVSFPPLATPPIELGVEEPWWDWKKYEGETLGWAGVAWFGVWRLGEGGFEANWGDFNAELVTPV